LRRWPRVPDTCKCTHHECCARQSHVCCRAATHDTSLPQFEMPELPEVEAARRLADKHCTGKRITVVNAADDLSVFLLAARGCVVMWRGARHRLLSRHFLAADDVHFPSCTRLFIGLIGSLDVRVCMQARSTTAGMGCLPVTRHWDHQPRGAPDLLLEHCRSVRKSAKRDQRGPAGAQSHGCSKEGQVLLVPAGWGRSRFAIPLWYDRVPPHQGASSRTHQTAHCACKCSTYCCAENTSCWPSSLQLVALSC
jgi:Formamidopyrimidine-DNA glycosylase N-terminal domain